GLPRVVRRSEVAVTIPWPRTTFTFWSGPPEEVSGLSTVGRPAATSTEDGLWLVYRSRSTGRLARQVMDGSGTWSPVVMFGDAALTDADVAVAPEPDGVHVLYKQRGGGIQPIVWTVCRSLTDCEDRGPVVTARGAEVRSRFGPAAVAFGGSVWLLYAREADDRLSLLSRGPAGAWGSPVDAGMGGLGVLWDADGCGTRSPVAPPALIDAPSATVYLGRLQVAVRAATQTYCPERLDECFDMFPDGTLLYGSSAEPRNPASWTRWVPQAPQPGAALDSWLETPSLCGSTGDLEMWFRRAADGGSAMYERRKASE
ncbi:MAG: hypothetical protein AABZ63_06615, partial [Actinomycetota bacterium]